MDLQTYKLNFDSHVLDNDRWTLYETLRLVNDTCEKYCL